MGAARARPRGLAGFRDRGRGPAKALSRKAIPQLRESGWNLLRVAAAAKKEPARLRGPALAERSCDRPARPKQLYQNLNRSQRSPSAGALTGTYALLEVVGFGNRSRPRLVIVGSFQFRSMNFVIETWSA